MQPDTPTSPPDTSPISQPPSLEPNQSQPTPAAAPASPNSPGVIVLQWLTYAFWGWTVLAMSVLTATVINSFINDADTGNFTAYAIAGTLVLLPISLVTDFFYSKKEPQHKTGAATIVMVIHAVLFALFGVGALISIVISLVTLFVSSTDTTGSKVALYSSMVILVLYIAVFLRTLNPSKIPWVRRVFTMTMVLVVGIMSILGVVGPVAQERARKNDRLLETHLNNVKEGVDAYVRSNNSLPDNLEQISVSGDAKKLLTEKLVTYKKLEQSQIPRNSLELDDLQLNRTSVSTSDRFNARTYYYYELCATYDRERDDNFDYYDDNNAEYQTYISNYSHPAGQVCYKLRTTN